MKLRTNAINNYNIKHEKDYIGFYGIWTILQLILYNQLN